jgi:hypothetical protein
MEHLMSKPLLSFRPKPEVAEAIRTMAAEDRRRVSQFLANLVEDAVAQRRAAAGRDASQQHQAA